MPNVIRVERTGGPEVLQWVELPATPPAAGEVRIRQTAIGVNFVDVYYRTGLYPPPGGIPYVPGSEGAGVIDALGDGVTGFKVGDRVVYQGWVGAYAEVRSFAADRVLKIPDGIDDSKQLPRARRETLFDELLGCAGIGVGVASVDEIDRVNILQASFLAMRRALAALGPAPAMALVDGHLVPPDLGCPAQAVVGGDARALSIAAASIVAKVTRDRGMVALAQQFPGYGWETNMGYGVAAHAEALSRLGVTPHHRRSFRPIHKMLCEGGTLSP